MKMDPFSLMSDDTLLEEILPSLPLDALTNFCITNRRIHALCDEDVIWAYRIQKEFPDKMDSKPPESSWYDYYFTIAPYKEIPIWKDRNIIGYEQFHVANELPSLALIKLLGLGPSNLINPEAGPRPSHQVPALREMLPLQNGVLIYTTKGLNPVDVVIYRNGEPIESKQYKDSLDKVARIIFSEDPDMIEKFRDRPIARREPKGRKPLLVNTQKDIERREQRLRQAIESQLRVYGILQKGYGVRKQLYITPQVYSDGLIEFEYDPRMSGYSCDTILRFSLVDLLYNLGIPPPELPVEEYIRNIIYKDIQDTIKKYKPDRIITQELVNYHVAWGNIARDYICQVIQYKFDEMELLVDTTEDGPFL